MKLRDFAAQLVLGVVGAIIVTGFVVELAIAARRI